jgi:hypothetical protein
MAAWRAILVLSSDGHAQNARPVKDALRFSTQQNKTLDTITDSAATSRSVFGL